MPTYDVSYTAKIHYFYFSTKKKRNIFRTILCILTELK